MVDLKKLNFSWTPQASHVGKNESKHPKKAQQSATRSFARTKDRFNLISLVGGFY